MSVESPVFPPLEYWDDHEDIIKIPMSLAEYLRLPEKPKSEWVRGVTLIMPPARFLHAAIHGRLIALLYGSLTDCIVLPNAGLRMPGIRRVPDIMVVKDLPADSEEVWIDNPPLLAVEIISPATHRNDEIFKRAEYLEKGVQQYWLVDRYLRKITVLVNLGTNWGQEIIIDDKHPQADIAVGTHGIVQLDLNKILG